MNVYGHGSGWDYKRRESRYWIGLETGAARDAFAVAGFALADLGGLTSSILEEIAVDEVALRRCPGGRASLALIGGEPRRRTIAAAVALSDRPVVSWAQALRLGEDPAELAPREMFGYTVDTGTGWCADAAL